MPIQTEWDPAKNQRNRAKHGLDFADAAEVFDGLVSVVEDVRRDYGEPRYKAIGMLGDMVVSVAFTVRGDAVRVISMRRAGRKERKAYEEARKERS